MNVAALFKEILPSRRQLHI